MQLLKEKIKLRLEPDDEEKEAVGVLVAALHRHLPLHGVHFLADEQMDENIFVKQIWARSATAPNNMYHYIMYPTAVINRTLEP